MQKALRRTLLARNQALRRERQDARKALKKEQGEFRAESMMFARFENQRVREERKARREDWMLGPLAPNRMAGKKSETYGLIEGHTVRRPQVPKQDREKYLGIAVNDRVVVVQGRERGNISSVESIDEDRQTVILKDVNEVDVVIPTSLRGTWNTPFRSMTLPLPLADVRLVAPLKDQFTGQIQDVVIDNIRTGAPFLEQPHGSSLPSHSRYVAGPDHIPIPWPKEEVEKFKAQKPDTARIVVDENTYDPSYLDLPLPESAGTELHSQRDPIRKASYSQELVEQKMREDAEIEWKKQRRILLPQQEFEEHRLAEKHAQGPPEITQETLDIIREEQARTFGRQGGGALP